MFTPQEMEEIRKADLEIDRDGRGRPRLTPEQKAERDERRREYMRAYYLANRQRITDYQREYIKKKTATQTAEDREKRNHYYRVYYKLNKDTIAERRKKYYMENRDVLMSRQMQYYYAKKEAARLLAQTERQRESTQGQYITIGGNCQCG